MLFRLILNKKHNDPWFGWSKIDVIKELTSQQVSRVDKDGCKMIVIDYDYLCIVEDDSGDKSPCIIDGSELMEVCGRGEYSVE
jgi:hypothetical protein